MNSYTRYSQMNEESKRAQVIIVGGGLVGALNAVFFGQSNKFDVILCEKRSDIRRSPEIIGRSINLALSHRGRSALRAVNLEEIILQSAIPMYARMIHEKSGSLKRIPYGKSNECIYAVDRKVFNELLLTEAERSPNVKILFSTKLVDADFKKKVVKLSRENEIIEVNYDLLVGNDGAYSTVRNLMSKNMSFNYSQEFIPHGYKELYFPPKSENSFLMDQNCLHIWPRNEFMLIGLPNPGGSFTGTLFMPFDIFNKIKSKELLFEFFHDNFPDALQMMGEKNLESVFFGSEASPMITIRCSPYNFEDSCVIMGDAAHAMVPFYGQGMNCGFEDLIIYHEILKKNNYQLGGVGAQFTNKRNSDAKAICELAFFNYVEMRKNVNSKFFILRKKFDNFMNMLFPNFWIPLYSMVSFSRIPYTKCIKERQKQDNILKVMRKVLFLFGVGSLVAANVWMRYRIRN